MSEETMTEAQAAITAEYGDLYHQWLKPPKRRFNGDAIPGGWVICNRNTGTELTSPQDTPAEAWSAARKALDARKAREAAAVVAAAEAVLAAERPTDRQRAYARRLGIPVTPSMTRRDVSAAIDAAKGDYPDDGYGGYVTRRTQDRYGHRGQIWDEE